MARKVTIKAFEAWIAVEANVARVLELVSGGTTLQKASLAVKQPYTCLQDFFRSTPELKERYATAREKWVEARKDLLVAKVEKVKADRDHVAKLRLEADIIDNQAKRFHRDAWGERLQVDRGPEVPGDAALLGFASELLKLVKAPEPRVIDGEVIQEPRKVSRG